MSEPAFVECEKCGDQIKRVITGGTGLIFKGSGFYLTDYKDGEKKSSDDENKKGNKSEKSKKKDDSKESNNKTQKQTKTKDKK